MEHGSGGRICDTNEQRNKRPQKCMKAMTFTPGSVWRPWLLHLEVYEGHDFYTWKCMKAMTFTPGSVWRPWLLHLEVYEGHDFYTWKCMKAMTFTPGSVWRPWLLHLEVYEGHDFYTWKCMKAMTFTPGSITIVWELTTWIVWSRRRHARILGLLSGLVLVTNPNCTPVMYMHFCMRMKRNQFGKEDNYQLVIFSGTLLNIKKPQNDQHNTETLSAVDICLHVYYDVAGHVYLLTGCQCT